MLKSLINRLRGGAAPVIPAPVETAMDPSETAMDQVSTIMRRQSLEATVIRACAGCGGKMLDDDGKPHDSCPACGTPRRAPENLGEIWHRDFT